MGCALCSLAGTHPLVQVSQQPIDFEKASLGQEGHHIGLAEKLGDAGLAPYKIGRIEVGHLWIAQRAFKLGDAVGRLSPQLESLTLRDFVTSPIRVRPYPCPNS